MLSGSNIKVIGGSISELNNEKPLKRMEREISVKLKYVHFLTGGFRYRSQLDQSKKSNVILISMNLKISTMHC